MDMTGPAEARVRAIKTRRLEIAADLAERRRAYFADGVESPIAERATLEAEDAKLALELRRIGAVALNEKAARRRQLNASLLANLLDVLKEQGLDHVVAEAERRSAAAAIPTTPSEGAN